MKTNDINIGTSDLKTFGPRISKANMNIRVDKQNNSTKIICFNIIFGITVSLVQMITEVTQSRIRNYEWITNALAFLITFIIIIVRKREMKLSLHYIAISLFYSLALFFKIYTYRSIICNEKESDNKEEEGSQSPVLVFISINLSCCLVVFFASLCFDRQNKFKWLHFISVVFVFLSFALYFYFNIVPSSLIEIIKTNQIWSLIASVTLFSITSLYQQIYFLSGSNIYHYLEYQGLFGFALFIAVSWVDRELSHFFSIHYTQFDLMTFLPYALYLAGMVAFLMVYPFYLKKAHCVMSTMFLGWKCLFVRPSNWLVCIGENALFFTGAVCFNIKRILKRDHNKNLFDNSIEGIASNLQNTNLSLTQDSYLRPLMNESFNDNFDCSFENLNQNNSADRQLAFYKQKTMTA